MAAACGGRAPCDGPAAATRTSGAAAACTDTCQDRRRHSRSAEAASGRVAMKALSITKFIAEHAQPRAWQKGCSGGRGVGAPVPVTGPSLPVPVATVRRGRWRDGARTTHGRRRAPLAWHQHELCPAASQRFSEQVSNQLSRQPLGSTPARRAVGR